MKMTAAGMGRARRRTSDQARPSGGKARRASHVGVASQMFQALAKEGINIQMISTSEIKITVVIDEKYMELAVRVLHDSFGLA